MTRSRSSAYRRPSNPNPLTLNETLTLTSPRISSQERIQSLVDSAYRERDAVQNRCRTEQEAQDEESMARSHLYAEARPCCPRPIRDVSATVSRA